MNSKQLRNWRETDQTSHVLVDPLNGIMGNKGSDGQQNSQTLCADEYKNMSTRVASFTNSNQTEKGLVLSFTELAICGYYYICQTLVIACSNCSFTRSFEEFRSNQDGFLVDHGKHDKNCPTAESHRMKPATSLHDSGLGTSITGASRGSNTEVARSTGLATISPAGLGSAMLYPSRSESRLPVPVNVTSNQGRLGSDTVLVQTAGQSASIGAPMPSDVADNSPSKPKPKETQGAAKSAGPSSNQLKYVPKPSCRQTDYDTYEGRLASYYDWPEESPMDKEELARAGFYYTHYVDKVKCPYCYGGVYNWEPTDTAFGEHVRHNPRCEFMKWWTYHCLTTSVPEAPRKVASTNVPFEELTTVKAVASLGYTLSAIREALGKAVERVAALTTDMILDIIFEHQKNTGRLLSNNTDDVHQLEGAVGGLNLNEENVKQSPDSESKSAVKEEDDIYSANQFTGDSGNEASFQSTSSNIGMEQAEVGVKSTPGPALHGNSKNESRQGAIVEDPEHQRMKEEYKRLQQANFCHRCRKNPVNILFLPCRHLVSCEECAEAIENCLQCDQEIIGTVKVFLT